MIDYKQLLWKRRRERALDRGRLPEGRSISLTTSNEPADLTVELTALEASTLLVALEKEIRRRTAHMHAAVGSKRAEIEAEVKCLQAVYDKFDAVPSRS